MFKMKRLLSQVFEKIYASHCYFKRLSTSSSSLIILFPLAQPAQDAARLFLIVVIVLIILLFVAVAILLPLTLRITSRRQKRGTPTRSSELTTVEADQTPVLQSSSVDDMVETIPVLAGIAEDLTATQPGLRTIKVEREPETLPISGQRPTHIGWQIAGLTDTGLRRELNEDNLLMLEADMPCGLYVVADGMGGHDAGEIASRLTVNSIQQHFSNHTPTAAASSLDDWLKSAAMVANQTVLANQGDRTEEKKMGSTLVMALVTESQTHIANVGDSRAYHLDGTGIRQVSVDHSLVERLIQIGQLTREEARTHKQKNVIYNTVGDKLDMEVGLYQVALQPGDRLLLCSDGLSGMITDEEILEISRSRPNPAEACKALIEAAKKAGGYDNITAIIVQMDGE
jgi:protein phosphatase